MYFQWVIGFQKSCSRFSTSAKFLVYLWVLAPLSFATRMIESMDGFSFANSFHSVFSIQKFLFELFGWFWSSSLESSIFPVTSRWCLYVILVGSLRLWLHTAKAMIPFAVRIGRGNCHYLTLCILAWWLFVCMPYSWIKGCHSSFMNEHKMLACRSSAELIPWANKIRKDRGQSCYCHDSSFGGVGSGSQ